MKAGLLLGGALCLAVGLLCHDGFCAIVGGINLLGGVRLNTQQIDML